MIASGALSVDEAWTAINYDTIILLFGMMIVVASLRLSGFFRLVSRWVVEHTHRPILLLAGIVGVAGVFSAFFVNDTMCLILTPLVLEITIALGRKPLPYLLAVAMASNIGSLATLTGNPQNMLVGSFSHIPYRTFTAELAPVAVVGLFLTVAVIALIHREEFRSGNDLRAPHHVVRVHRALMWKSLGIAAAMIVFFFAGSPVPKVALVAGGLLLVTRRVKPERIYHQIDWQLLVLFMGLFVVLAAMEKTGLATRMFEMASRYHLDTPTHLAVFTAVLSNTVSNVPAILIFRDFVPHLADPARAWLTIAMSSTLAGNLTVLGSVANLIVIEHARHAVRIGAWEYCKTGIPLTLLTLAIGLWMIN